MILVVVAAAVAVWFTRMRCEGFSCTYVGVAWILWVLVFFLPTLVLGVSMRFSEVLPVRMARLVRQFLRLHLVIGFGLACWWIYQRSHG